MRKSKLYEVDGKFKTLIELSQEYGINIDTLDYRIRKYKGDVKQAINIPVRKYNIEDMIGKKVGRLTVIDNAGKNKWNQDLWLCKCDCGNAKVLSSNVLKMRTIKSCGCLRSEKAKEYTNKQIEKTHLKTL